MSSGPADKALDVFKTLIFDALVKAAIARIISVAPAFAWGPLSFIITKVVWYVANALYEEMHTAINFQIILLNNRKHHDAYIEAQMVLLKIAKDKGIDSDEFENQRVIHQAALRKFIRYTGTT